MEPSRPGFTSDDYKLQQESLAPPKDTVLFSNSPSIRDIKQGGLGDCYFLTIFASIVSTSWGHEFIMSHMRESKGRIYVKFYDKEQFPVLVVVEKTIIGSTFNKKVEPNQDGSYPIECFANKENTFTRATFNINSAWIVFYEKAWIIVRDLFYKETGSFSSDVIEGGGFSDAKYILGPRYQSETKIHYLEHANYSFPKGDLLEKNIYDQIKNKKKLDTDTISMLNKIDYNKFYELLFL